VQEQTTSAVEPATEVLEPRGVRDDAAAGEDLPTDPGPSTGRDPSAGPRPEAGLEAAGRDSAAAAGTAAQAESGGTGGRPAWRTAASWALTGLAVLFILFALVLPNRLQSQSVWSFVRLPLELILGVGVLLLVRPRVRPWAAACLGLGLGLLLIVKIADIGFYATLGRPFNLVLDWILLDDAVSFLQDSIGRAGGIATAAGIVALAAGLVALATLSALRLNRLVAGHASVATRSVLALGIVWIVLAAFGVHIHPQVPVATRSTLRLVEARRAQVHEALADKEVFAKESRRDAFRGVPGDQLLTALRGKDVIISFVESYGRSAIEDPRLAPVVDPVLDAGTRDLAAAGFASRSAFLASPTAGGGSWLAHSTFLSGLWISTQQRYRTLLASDRLTLTRCFQRAGWRTVSFEPGTVRPFPEGSLYSYDQTYLYKDFGYRGPRFSWSTMPDQYTLQTFQDREYGRAGRGPLLAEITLTSSHTPWAPLPEMVDWTALGDGSVFGPIERAGDRPTEVWKDARQVRAGYARSIAYSVQSLISFVKRYGRDNLVLVFLGDHQPAPLVTGAGASRDVPITIVAADPAVMDRIAGWHWQNGLNPGPKAPVWRMDTFRDRFLSTFGPQSAH